MRRSLRSVNRLKETPVVGSVGEIGINHTKTTEYLIGNSKLDVRCSTFMGLDFSPLRGGFIKPPALRVVGDYKFTEKFADSLVVLNQSDSFVTLLLAR